MVFLHDPILNLTQAELIEQVSYRTGLSATQVASLIDCELDIRYVLEYITAVLSDRMN
jgi:hypothetical protein